MDPILLLKALILGIVEGLTEFLPISSTGHLIIIGSLLDYTDEQSKVFKIVIQLGAILAVVLGFRERIGKVVGGLQRPGTAAFRRPADRWLPAGRPSSGALSQHDQGLPVQPVDRRIGADRRWSS
jgi:undecaprenyl pyrophosphate phosphatase UppP